MANFFELLKRIVSNFPKGIDCTVPSGKEVFPRVYDSQLEDRRVLNAGAVVSAIDLVALHFDAGQSANDGIADTFELTRLDTPNATNQIAVSINNQRVWQGNSAELQSIRFDGSSDADQFYIDPTIHVPAGITIDGTGIATRSPAPGTTDTIVFAAVSGTRFDEITYRTTDHLTQVRFVMPATPLNAAYPLIASSPSHAVVEVQNVEIIQDLNFASNRSMVVESSSRMYSLKGSAEPDRSSASHSVQWTSDQGRIHFAVPSNRLAIDFRGATTGQHSLAMDSTDLSGVEQFDVFGKDTDSVQQHGDLLTGRKMSIQAGAIHVNGTVSTATDGELRLDAGSGDLTVNGQILSRGDDLHLGGNVVLTGERVLLQERTRVDVSGGRGGGQIRVGGGYQGQDSSVRNSRYTFVSGNATLNADARLIGNGGTVIVWSDDTSIIDGSGNIFARGGLQSGNGGFIETSGKRYLWIDGAANTFAYQGQVGTWLIDPNDIEIVTAAGAAANTTYITTATIASGLTTGNVSIITNTASPANGDIRIVAALTLSPTVSRTLTLNATRDIVFQSGLTGNANLQVNLTAGRNVDSTAVSIGQLGSLTIDAAGNISVGAINLSGGTLTATVDSDNNANNATFQSTGALSAGVMSFTGSAAGNDDLTFGSTVTTTTGAIQFSALDDLSFQGDVTAATNVTFTNVAGPLSLGSNVDVTATNGPLDFSTITSAIVLAGSNGSTNILRANGATGSLTLGSVTATNPTVALTLSSATNTTVGSINIQNGTLTSTIDSDNNNVNATFQSTGALSAGAISMNGSTTVNDDLTFGSTVTTTTGSIQFSALDDLSFQGDVTAATNVTFANVAGPLSLGSDVDVTATNGPLDFSTITSGIVLVGNNGTTNILRANGATGSLTLGSVTATNPTVALTLSSATNTTVASINIQNGTLTSTIDSDNNNVNATFQSTGTLSAGAISMNGSAIVNDDLTFGSTVTTSTGTIQFSALDDLSFQGDVTAATNVTFTNVAGPLSLGSDVDVTATNGPLDFSTITSGIVLVGNNGTTNILRANGATGSLTLGSVTATNATVSLTLSSATNTTVGSVNIQNGTLTSTVDSDNNNVNATFQSTGALSAGAISMNGSTTVNDDLTFGSTVIATTGALQFSALDDLSFQGDVTAATNITFTNVAGPLALGSDVDVTATNGPLDFSTITSGILLAGNNGSTNILRANGATGSLTLGSVTATNPTVALTLSSATNTTVGSINIQNGTLTSTIDSDNNNVNATFQSTGALSAGAISFTGTAAGNDDITFGSTVATTTGAIQFSALDDLSFQGDVSAATNITFATVSGPLSLGSNVDITSNSGQLDFTTMGSGIVLNGDNGTTNIITANSATGSIKLAAVTATNTSVSLTLNSATDLDANDINIQSGDLVATYSGQNVVPANVATFQKVTARSMTVSGNSRTDDQTVLADTLTIGIGGVTINQFSDLRINASVTSDAGVTTTGIAGSTTRLAANVTSKGGNIAMTGGTLLIDGSATRTIFSGGGGVAAGGNIVLGNIDGENGAASLTVDSRGTTTAGAVTLGAVTADTSGLNRLNIQTSVPTASGQVTLSSTRLVGKALNTAATLVVSSDGKAIRANGDIDLSSNDTIDGGSIDFGSSEITPTTASSTLTLKTSNTNPSGGNGGEIKFGGVSNNGANYFDSVQIDTSVANGGGTAGDLDFNGAASPRIAVDGTTGTGISLIGTIVKAFSGVLSFLTNPTGASTNSSSIDVSKADFQSTAGLAFDTSGGGASTSAGNVVLGDIGVLAANRPSSLSVDTRGSAASGDLQLDDGAGASTEVHVNGDLNLANTKIKLTDNALLRTYGTGNMTLGDVSTSTAVARNLTLNSEANIAVSAINLTGGTLNASIDSDNNNAGATFQSTGALSAGAISISGSTTVNDDVTFGSTVTSTTGAIQFSALDDLLFQGDVTAATNVTFANVAGPLSLGSDVDVTATNGPLDFSTITSGIVLVGNNGTTNILRANGATGSLTLGSVTATNPTVALTLSSATNTTVASINIQNGMLTSTIDSDNNNVNATFQSTGSLSAGAISMNGSTTVNDDVTFGSTVTATTGAIQFSALDDLSFQGDVTAATNVTFTNVAGPLSLGSDVDVTATNGPLDFSTITSGIVLAGNNGTTNILRANGATGSLTLGSVTATNSTVALTLSSATNTTVGSIDIKDGTLTSTIDSDNNNVNATFQSTGALSAGAISMNGSTTVNDDLTFGSTVTATTGAIQFSALDDLSLQGDVTAATNVTFTNVAGPLSLGSDVDVTATNGPLDFSTITSGILLAGNNGSTNILRANGATGSLTLGSVTATNPTVALTLSSATNTTVGSINIQNGTLTSTIDSDNNNVNATFQSTGALSAGAISFTGTAAGNDDITFGSTVATTTGAIQFTALDDLLFQGDVTSATNITFATVSGPLSLGSSVDITSNSGQLDFTTMGSGIVLNGDNGTTNIITANSATGSIKLAAVTATNTSVSLTLNSATDLDANDINIQSGDLVATYSGQNVVPANVATFQKVTARSMTVSGNSRTDDQTVLADTLTIGIGGVTINQFSDLRINASVTSDAGVTTTGIAGSTTRLAANVTSKGGNIAMTGGTLLIDGSATRTIFSGGGGVAAGGNIVLGNIDGENGAASLTVDSRGTTTAGAVTLGAVTADTSGLNRLNIQTSVPTASGQVTLSSTRLVGKALNTAATLVVSSDGKAIRANGDIDLSSNDTIDGGSIDFGSSEITPTTASSTLTLKTSNTNPSGGNGGEIKFGGVSNNGANYFDSVQIDTSVANGGGTAGDLDFNGAASPRIAVDGTTGTGISLIGTIVKAFSGVLSFLTNPTGASTNSSSIDVSKADFQSTAGLAFDTSGGGASTSAGNVVLGDIGVLAANRPSSLSVDTRGSAASGDLQLDDGAGASTEVHVNGDLNLANTKIKLTDNALLRTYGTGNMTLGDVSTSTAVARNLTLNSEANIAVSAINLTGGTLNASIDSDNNNAGATFQSTGVLTAGTVTIAGSTALNDQVTISSTLNATTGAIQFSQIGSLVLNGDVIAQTSVAFNSIANELILGSNVDVTANNGPIDFSVIASGIRLTGSNGSTNILTANGATGNLSLGNVLVNNTTVSLTLRSAANTTVGSINLQNGTFTSSIDSDNNNLGSTFVSTGALSAGAVTISGSTTVNDDVTLGSTVTTTTGAIQVIRFDDLRINGDWTSAGGVTTTGISVSKTHLAANITTNGGNISMLDGTLLVNGTTVRQIKSGGASVNATNGGAIALGTIDGAVATADLELDSRGTNTSGSVTLGDVTAASGNNGLNRLQITSAGPGAGQVSLSNIRLIAKNGTAASLTVSSSGRAILADGTIDLSSNVNGQAGGNIDFGTSIVAPKSGSSTLNINTSNTNTTSGPDGSNGGDVLIGGIGVNSAEATYFNSVTLDVSAADILDSAGTLRFGSVANPSIQVDGVTGTGIRILGRIDNAAGGITSLSTNPAGAIQNSSAIDVSRANFIGSGGLVFDTSGGNRATNSGSVSLGDIGITVRPVSLVVDTRGTVSSGHLLFDDGVAGSPTEIRVDGTIDFSGVAVDLLDDVALSSFSDGGSLLLGATNAIGGARSLQLSSNSGMTVASINLTGGALQAVVDANNNEAGAIFRSTGVIATGSFTLNGSATNDDTAIIETSLTTTGTVIVSNLDQLRIQGTVTAGTTFTATNIVGAVDFSGNSGVTANGSVDLQTSVNAVRLSGVAGNTTLIDARGNASVVSLAAVTATNPGTLLNIRSDYSADLRNVDLQTGTLDIQIGRSTTLADSKAQLRQVIAGGLVVAGTSTANDSVVLDGLLDIGVGGVRIQNLANLDMNFNVQSDGELVATNISNRIRVAEAVSVQSDLGVDMQTNVGQIQLIGINGLTHLFRANGDSSTLKLAAIQALQNVVLQITSANNIQVTSIDAVGSNVTMDVDSNDNTVGSQLNAGQIQAAQITILGGSEQNDTATFSGIVESKAGSILVNSFGTVNVNGNLLSSAGLEVSNVSGRVSLGAGRLVKASNGDASLNNGVNEIRFVGGTGTTASIQSLNGNLSVAALTELATSDLIELRADRDVALRSTLLNSRFQVVAGDRNSNTGTINATSTLTAGSISFEAATGIGTNAPVAISASTISASNRLAGAIQVANNKSGTILVTNLTSNQGGNILFAQSGGGLVRFQGVTSNPDGTPALNESDIRLTNDGNSIVVEGTGITAGGRGNVSLETLNSGDVVFTSATQAIGGNVGVQSARRILGAGTLRGPSVGLNAQSGIGTTGPVQTETAQLSANTQFNSLDLQNTSPTLATVSQLRSGGLGTVQFKQVGGGDVAISNVSTGLASTNAGSNIQLRNDNGSVSIQGSIVAGGGGSIRFDAQNNLVIGAGAIVQTNAVNATIRGDAGGQFRFTPGATLRAGSSNATTEAVVTEIPPAVSVRPALNSLGVNVDSLGLASLQIQLGSSPFIDRNYSVVIDWGDNQIDNFANGSISPLTINPQISRFDASGAIYTITHQYQGNPNIVDPIADIPVKVTVGVDALNRIQFNDSQGASTNLTRVIDERFVVPAAGLFSLRFDLPQAATVQSRIVFTNSVLVQADNNVAPPVPSAEIVVSSGSSAVEKSRSYVLRVITLVSEQGEIASSKDIELSEKDIEDLSSGKLFQKLGDNRYRIYLIREDGSELLLKDFYLRNHRPFEVEDAPASSNIAPSDERVLDQDSVSIPRPNLGTATLGNGEFEALDPEVQELGAMRSEATSEEKPIANALLAVGTVSQARRSWRKAARRFRAS